ncbi:MAG TPA: hypothetical protein VGM04_03425 [Sphingomicrobium sp.]|jgi:hypothetical protein
MRKYLSVFCALSVSSAAPAAAREACPARSTAPLAWAIDEVMSGDLYADIYLDVNEEGRPTACRMGRTNILGDDKFFVCKAFMDQWSTQAPRPAGRTTVKRQYIEYGMKHADAERAARNRYFLEHPYQRPECYPKDASTGYRVLSARNVDGANSR